MLGFSLLKHSFQFVEIQYQNGKPVVYQFAKRPTPIPFTPQSVIDADTQAQYHHLIEDAIHFYKLSGPVVVSLDSRFVLVKKFAMDLAISEAQVEEQINWECRQILPEDEIAEYQFSYERLAGGVYPSQDTFLIVTLRKKVVAAVKNLFADTPLTVKFLTLDLFSALHSINRIYGIREQDFCILADLHRDAVKLLVVRKGEIFDIHSFSFNERAEENGDKVFESDENLAKLLNKEIRRKLLEYRFNSEEKVIDSLFLYGERASSELVNNLQNSPAREVLLVEPFKKLELNADKQNFKDGIPISSEYTICVGSALRSIP